jgi:hypothetical protein
LFYDRKYVLASEEARARVDLRDYEDLIRSVVGKIVPKAKVIVKRDCFIVDRLTRGQSRSLGRELSKTELVKHRQMVCRLFAGSPATEEERKVLHEKRNGKNVRRHR